METAIQNLIFVEGRTEHRSISKGTSAFFIGPLWRISLFNLLQGCLWQLGEECLEFVRCRDAAFNYHIDQFKKRDCSCFVVFQVNLAGMDRVVTDYPYDIECLLDFNLKTFSDLRSYVVIEILTGLFKVNH
jgi:hypothetical protein